MSQFTSILAGASAIGGGVTAFGQVLQGNAEKEAAEFNADIADQEATLIRQGAVLNEYRQRKRLAEATGEQVGKFARAGVSVDTGTPLDVVADSISNAEMEIQIDQFNSAQAARRRVSDAKQIRRQGTDAMRFSRAKAVGTFLTTAVQAGSRLSKEKGKVKKEKIGQ